MTNRILYTLLLVVLLLPLNGMRAEDAGGNKPAGKKPDRPERRDGPPGRPEAPLFDFVLKHADDLKLTPEQKTKLEELAKDVRAEREKLMADPEIRDLFKQLKEARESKDQTAMREVLQKLKEKHDTADLGNKPHPAKGIMEILTDEQKRQLRELMAQQATMHGDGGGPKHRPGDGPKHRPGDGPPNGGNSEESRTPDKSAPPAFQEF